MGKKVKCFKRPQLRFGMWRAGVVIALRYDNRLRFCRDVFLLGCCRCVLVSHSVGSAVWSLQMYYRQWTVDQIIGLLTSWDKYLATVSNG